MAERVTYLQVGNYVYHQRYCQWGIGKVVEEWNATLPERPCFIKVEFQDRCLRVFDNDFSSRSCCYYRGLMQIDAGD
jgi:hypothetical protein